MARPSFVGRERSRGSDVSRVSSRASLSDLEENAAPLPPGCEFHYFLSHKKKHSAHGAVPAQIARNLHDSLELLGYKGWFDVDNLSRVTKDALRSGIQKCAAMIVVLTDETHLSEWCAFEWEVAAELELPVKVVVDMEHCSKQAALDLISRPHPNLMSFQWSELTERHRRGCLSEVSTFLDDVMTGHHGDSEYSDRRGDDTPLRFGGADGSQVMHPVFENLLLFGGVPYRAPTRRISRVWRAFVRCGRPLCLSVCAVRMIYARGPAFTDIHSAMTVVLFHLYVFYAPAQMNRALVSEGMSRMLASLEGGTTMEVGQRLRAQTLCVGLCISVFTAAGSAMLYLAYMPLFFHECYIGPDAAWWDKVFGWTSGFAFVFLIPPIIASFGASFALMYLLLCLGTLPMEASFDILDPRIRELGLHRFAAKACLPQLRCSNHELAVFQRAWNAGLQQYCTIQRQLVMPQSVGLGTAAVALVLPLRLWLMGFVFDHSVHWAHAVRHLVVWVAVGILTLTGVMFPPLWCTGSMARLREAALLLVMDNPVHRVFVTQVCCMQPLTCWVASAIPATRPVALGFLFLVAASCAPWLLLEFWGQSLLARIKTTLDSGSLGPGHTDAAGGDDIAVFRLAAAAGGSATLMAAYATWWALAARQTASAPGASATGRYVSPEAAMARVSSLRASQHSGQEAASAGRPVGWKDAVHLPIAEDDGTAGVSWGRQRVAPIGARQSELGGENEQDGEEECLGGAHRHDAEGGAAGQRWAVGQWAHRNEF